MPSVSRFAPYKDEKRNVIHGTIDAIGSRVVFKSSDCSVTLGEGVQLTNASIIFEASGGHVTIGKASQFKGFIRIGLNCRVTIGERLSLTGKMALTAAEGTTVEIGDDCMFATSVEVRSDDSHPIFDAETGERLNKSESIKIGSHVWLAGRSVVLGGVTIGDGAVIGHSAVVLTDIPKECTAVGIPARPVRHNVIWSKAHLSKTAPHSFNHISDVPIERRYPQKT